MNSFGNFEFLVEKWFTFRNRNFRMWQGLGTEEGYLHQRQAQVFITLERTVHCSGHSSTRVQRRSTATCSPIHRMMINCATIMLDVLIWLIKIQCFSSYICQCIALSFSPLIEEAHQPNSKNDKSQKRDDTFLIWLDALPQLSFWQFLIGA
jgi:hypothetical protein